MKGFFFVYFLFLWASISANPLYDSISSLIENGKIREAQKILDENSEWKGNPTILQFQTEIWIREAEIAFQTRNYSRALELYEKAYPYWPLHPVVQERIPYLKNLLQNSVLSARPKSNSPKLETEKLLVNNLENTNNLVLQPKQAEDKYYIPFLCTVGASFVLNFLFVLQKFWMKK
jgi:tetratricopeptide (TPR) repeat protein